MTEWNSDADNGRCIVALDHLDCGVSLRVAMISSLLLAVLKLVVRRGWASDEDAVDCAKDAAFAKHAKDPSELSCRNEFLAGFQQEYTAFEHGWIARKPSGGQQPLNDLDTTTPGAPRNAETSAGPVHASVGSPYGTRTAQWDHSTACRSILIARLGDFESFTGEEGRTK